MAKRPYADFEDEIASGGGATKKAKIVGAMEHLTDRADDLIECLQALKRQGKDADVALTQRLTALSRDLLPSFQSMAKADDAMDQPLLTQTPVLPVLTAWNPSEVADRLPPLPPVLDPSLERASRTHAGSVNGPEDSSYEQLEWLGDAYLYLMSTVYIYLTFPHLKHGDMAQIREVLVRNATLKDYSLQYGLDKQINFPSEYSLNGRPGGTRVTAKQRDKVLGDVFEARVAAIILSDPISGVATAAAWLKSLWSTTIPEQIKGRTWQGQQAPQQVKSSVWPVNQSLLLPAIGLVPAGQEPQGPTELTTSGPGRMPSAKEKLAADLALHKPRVTIEYRSLDNGRAQKRDPLTKVPLFVQGVYLVGYGEDVFLGSGKDKNKKVAGEKAALFALGNKKLIKVYREKKQSILEARNAAEQSAKGSEF